MRATGTPMLCRSVNERILALATSHLGMTELICECSDGACTAIMRMIPAEHDDMVALGSEAHAVLPGHERRDLDTVVSRTDRYVVVCPPRIDQPTEVA